MRGGIRFQLTYRFPFFIPLCMKPALFAPFDSCSALTTFPPLAWRAASAELFHLSRAYLSKALPQAERQTPSSLEGGVSSDAFLRQYRQLIRLALHSPVGFRPIVA